MTALLPISSAKPLKRSTNPNTANLSRKPLAHVNSILLLREERKQKLTFYTIPALKPNNYQRVHPLERGDSNISQTTVSLDDLLFSDSEGNYVLSLDIREKSASVDSPATIFSMKKLNSNPRTFCGKAFQQLKNA